MTDKFNYQEWFNTLWNTYLAAKDLFYNKQGNQGIEGKGWRKSLKQEMACPGLYEQELYDKHKDKDVIEVNCTEVLERLREDIRYRRSIRSKGEEKFKWQLPMFSVYYGQGERGRRYMDDIPSYTDTAVKDDSLQRFCKCGSPSLFGYNTPIDDCLSCYDKNLRKFDYQKEAEEVTIIKTKEGIIKNTETVIYRENKIDYLAGLLRRQYEKMGVADMTKAQQTLLRKKLIARLSH